MTAEEKEAYGKIVNELLTMSARLRDLAENAYEDMEGANEGVFRVSETLWSLVTPARRLTEAATQIQTTLFRDPDACNKNPDFQR